MVAFMTQATATRDRIIDTARKLFHQRGFNEVGINDLCREAQVVKGSFYHFFDSKDALLETVINTNAKTLADGLAELEACPLSGREKLLAQLHGALDKARAQQAEQAILGCDIGNLAVELAAYHPHARSATGRAFRQWIEVLERMVAAGIADGSLSPGLDPAQTASGFLAVLQGISTLGRTMNDLNQLADVVTFTEQQLLPAA